MISRIEYVRMRSRSRALAPCPRLLTLPVTIITFCWHWTCVELTAGRTLLRKGTGVSSNTDFRADTCFTFLASAAHRCLGELYFVAPGWGMRPIWHNVSAYLKCKLNARQTLPFWLVGCGIWIDPCVGWKACNWVMISRSATSSCCAIAQHSAGWFFAQTGNQALPTTKKNTKLCSDLWTNGLEPDG